MAVPLLPRSLTGALIRVEIAWGADVTAASSTWTWTDITTDVRIKDGINLKHGRGDEAEFSQPASCSLVLSNSTGAYSLGGQSPNWPNVKKNTPVRVSVYDGVTYSVMFLGYADSWSPAWTESAKDATVELTASGILRRLEQHDAPVLSSLRRRLSTESNVVGYWPLEEGKLATIGLAGIPNCPDMFPSGVVDWAGDTDTFASTVQMPVLKNGQLWANLPAYTFTPTVGQQVRALMSFPENGSGMTNDGIIMRVQLAHPSVTTIDILYGTGGNLRLVAWQQVGLSYTVRHDTGYSVFNMDGRDIRLFLELQQVGANVTFRYGIQTPGGGSLAVGATIGGGAATLGRVSSVTFGAHNDISGLAIGHVTVQNAITSVFNDAKELDAFEGEVSFTRFSRLMGENGIESTVSGDTTAFDQITDKMGEQRPEPLLPLLQQIQEVDRGVIYDGRAHGGLTFLTRRAIENSTVDLTLNVAAGELAGVLAPVDDDQALLNRAVVSRMDGATAVYEDSTGPLGTNTVGTYDSSLTIPVASDAAAIQYASWLVSLGTVEGYRYPSIEVDLAKNPGLISAMTQLNPGDRVALTNVSTTATQHPTGTVRLVVQGIEQTLTPYSWRATLTCTPYDPWSIGRTVNTDGTTVAPNSSEDDLRLDTAGSQLNTAASSGATSLSVATTSGPLWTTAAADLPLDISVGGIAVRVTAISGATSPQTFTVTGVTKALASGLPIQLYSPPSIGL